jgi:hypothetical protein
MLGDFLLQREPNQTVSESARIFSLYDLTPEEEFHHCVHLTAGSSPRRCGKRINKQDRERAKCLYLKIRSSLADATLMQDSLLAIAKLTLCNHVHRPRGETEVLYTRMVQKWSNDVDTKQAVIGCPSVPNAATDRKDPPENSTISPGPNPATSKFIHREGLPFKATASGDDHSLDGLETLVQKKDFHRETTGVSLCGPRQRPYARYGANTMSPPQPLPKRVTRSGTFSQPDDEYQPYCPQLLTLTPSELIHCRNTSVLSLLARPLKPMAEKAGCVYIFTRPDDPSLVKIGFTKHSGQARVAAWGKECCYAARLEFATEMMPHAWQVERLVQEQLKQYRRKERRCKWKATCSKQHQEWYEISVKEARRVVEIWAGWIMKYRPWGADNALTPDWAQLLSRYRTALNGPDRDADLWDRWARMEEPREADPVVRSPILNPKTEQHSSSLGIDSPEFDHQSPSSTASQDGDSQIPQPLGLHTNNLKSLEGDCSHTDSKIVLKLRLSISHTKTSKGFKSECSTPLSSVPSQPTSPTMLLSLDIPHPSHQAFSDTLRAALKSALSNLDAYNGASLGRKECRTDQQHTIRVDNNPVSLA